MLPALLTQIVSVPDPIKGFYLCEILVSFSEFSTKALDVAIDGAVVNIDILAVRRVDQLITVLDVTRVSRQRLDDKEFGYRQIDLITFPGAKVAGRVQN